MSFLDSLNSAIGSLASNADKIIGAYGGILQRKNDLAMMRARQRQQLAALKAQTAVSIAQQKASTVILPDSIAARGQQAVTAKTALPFNMSYLAIGVGVLAVAAIFVLRNK